MKETRWVYSFGAGRSDGGADDRNLLGGKGANLAEMTRLGIPVPPGFTISTDACRHALAHGGALPDGLREQVDVALRRVEEILDRRFGSPERTLLVSVRSGARVSMPGMMDTVLNIGLNDATAQGMIRATGNERFVWDSYRRFVQMYGNVVLGVPSERLEGLLEELKEKKGVELDTELGAADLRGLVPRLKERVREVSGAPFPEDAKDQLWGAVSAVFRSWNVPRAVAYRRIHGLPDDWGTAVNVQAMVFGNLGSTSATGVAFTRDPSTGEKRFFGEYLVNAQGEDVVAGIRTPSPLAQAASREPGAAASLEETMPALYGELSALAKKIEAHYRDMQDLEFTIEEGRLWLLQTRSGKRTAHAAVKIAVDLVGEGTIDERQAVQRVDPADLDQLMHPRIDPEAPREELAKGLPASPGAASGKIAFTAEEAVERTKAGEAVILVRRETSPEDIEGMHAALGILTATGGMTSHAAVVARGMGKSCVAGAGGVVIDAAKKTVTMGGRALGAKDAITLDGGAGRVYAGRLPTLEPELSGEFRKLMEWADERRTMGVRANADTPADAEVARGFGAEGIGLCRTEHMFFGEERIRHVRRMILAETVEERASALEALLPFQREDFEGILEAMDGLPVTIRLLDPPLHEFLPHEEEAIRDTAKATGRTEDEVRRRAQALTEFNPMLGHRGCRLGVTFPEIYRMQVRAIYEAAASLARKGKRPLPEVMIPLVSMEGEIERLRAEADETARDVLASAGVELPEGVVIGTMIEIPRAAIRADVVARHADFFSFGTNDLTQLTYGFSRDDVGKFLPEYLERGLLKVDPFASLDAAGVGELVEMGTARGRETRPDLKVGVCGEHGGDPASVAFFHEAGLDYVSCSPFRVPVARLAAAQAALRSGAGAPSPVPSTV